MCPRASARIVRLIAFFVSESSLPSESAVASAYIFFSDSEYAKSLSNPIASFVG